MMSYIFKYKKGFFWRKKEITGHHYIKDMDRMDIFFKNGSVYSIAGWSKYDLILGVDWVLYTKKQMEKESATTIKM